MLYAVIARPPVLGGKVESFDAAEALKVPGVVKVVADRRHAAARGVPAARRRRRRRQGHLGGDQGPQGAEDRLGRRPARQLRLGGLSRRARGGRAEAAARSCATRATSTPRMASAAKQGRGRLLRAAPRARDDGAAGGHRAHRQRRAARSGRRTQAPQAARDRVAKRLGTADRRTSRSTSRCSAAASAASRSPTSSSRPRCCRRRWTASPSR